MPTPRAKNDRGHGTAFDANELYLYDMDERKPKQKIYYTKIGGVEPSRIGRTWQYICVWDSWHTVDIHGIPGNVLLIQVCLFMCIKNSTF